MAEIDDKLCGLLNNARLRSALADVLYANGESPGQFRDIELVNHIHYARERFEELETVFQAFVVDELPAPPPLTAADLASIAISQLAGVPLAEVHDNDEGTRAFQRFVTFAMMETEAERSTHPTEYLQIGEDWLLLDEKDSLLPEEPLENFPEFELWKSAWFSLYGRITRPWEGEAQVQGILKGYCSERAFEEAQSTLEDEDLVRSISRTAQWCATEGEFDLEDHDSPIRYFTPITFLIRGDGRRVMSTCWTASFARPAEDELMDRLRNATVLLFHADQVGSDPLAVSLIFAAIEALVCEEGGQTTKQIKEHVSTLLVQDAQQRKARERVMDKLYRIRCDVLHGRKIHGLPNTYEIVRIIAAAVVRAVVCWRENQVRVGGETTWKELMDELHAASRKPSIVVGIPDLSELIPSKLS